MAPFGSVWGPSGGARPSGLIVSFITGKCKFFMNDRWIFVGNVFLVQNRNSFRPVLPDCDRFFDERRELDDGSDMWRQWGPRVN